MGPLICKEFAVLDDGDDPWVHSCSRGEGCHNPAVVEGPNKENIWSISRDVQIRWASRGRSLVRSRICGCDGGGLPTSTSRRGSLLVVFAPTAYRVYHDIADFKQAGEDIPQWDLNDLPDRLRRMISEISPDIGYLDLTPALKSAAQHNTLVFFSDDTHWSSEGHQVVAEALAKAAHEKPYSDVCRTAVSSSR